MTVVDTSALAAIVFGEPDAEALSDILHAAGDVVISAATRVEAGIVVEARRGDPGRRRLEALLTEAEVAVIALDDTQAAIAMRGWRRFGKGRHPAGLNLGDCYAYALATSRDEPLLYKGDDFAQTDVRAAY